jgi:hypothetical protein
MVLRVHVDLPDWHGQRGHFWAKKALTRNWCSTQRVEHYLLIKAATISGVKVSVPKLIWGKPGSVGAPTMEIASPRLVSDMFWIFVEGFAVALGREMDTIAWVVRDTLDRVAEASRRVHQASAVLTSKVRLFFYIGYDLLRLD